MSTSQQTPSGVLFSPNRNNKSYLSVFYHRNGTNGKSQWSIGIPEEFNLFCISDDNNWVDANGDYWGVLNNGTSCIGTANERVCKFEPPSLGSVEWHGYPVSASSPALQNSQDRLKAFVLAVQSFIDSQSIDPNIGKRIQRGKL